MFNRAGMGVFKAGALVAVALAALLGCRGWNGSVARLLSGGAVPASVTRESRAPARPAISIREATNGATRRAVNPSLNTQPQVDESGLLCTSADRAHRRKLQSGQVCLPGRSKDVATTAEYRWAESP